MTTIVCGTDLSEASAPARAVAAALAQRAGKGELHLAHVAAATADEAARAKLQERLEAEAAALRALVGPRVQTRLLAGEASEAMLAFAEETKADLVVVASHGEANTSLFFLGGTAERVSQAGRFPVIVARDAGPFEAWAKGERALRVVIGVDWTASSDPALSWVRALRRVGPCDVVAAHVYYPEEPQRLYGLAPASAVDADPKAVRLIERDLATRVGELGGQGSVEFVAKLAVGRAGDHLIELACDRKADLVVVGTHKVSGLSRLTSISSVVLRFCTLSVACVGTREARSVAGSGRPRLQHVLVATDLSPFSNLAVPYAYEMLCERGGQVHLLHVLPHGKDDVGGIKEQLHALVPEFALRAEIVTDAEVVHSNEPARAICEAAERVGADVICIASHGRSGVTRLVLGSVAEAVLRQTARSLFIVRPPKD
ncbi:MAG TPA: universal stress protein [Myxococcales bacterium]|jgi:nucleotide-binding universal stress UspA family protein